METIEFIPVANYAMNPTFGFVRRIKVSKEEFIDSYKKKEFYVFWNKFHFRALIDYQDPREAIDEIYYTFEYLKGYEKEIFNKFHKGNPYYYLGISYFMLEDFESAVYYVNAAAKEDLEIVPPNYPSPATWFIEVQSEPQNQAGRFLVKRIEEELDNLIIFYNCTLLGEKKDANFSIIKLREKLLSKSVDLEEQKYQTISTTFLSYILEYKSRIKTLNVLDSLESIEPFVFHLFKGCVLLESIIRENPTHNDLFNQKDTLGDLIHHIFKYIDIPHNISFDEENLQKIVDDLHYSKISLEKAFTTAGKIRNKVGHSIEWKINIEEEQYNLMYKLIGIACLHAINKLY